MTGGQMADADDRRTVTRARESQPLSTERVEEIRARILAGAYATEPVLQEIARAILERGDL
jgi:anti-sigma28 factor (negative regulator of flagellin synthesis)